MDKTERPTREVSYRFPQRLRLKTTPQFRVVYDAKVCERSGPLVVYARPNGLGHLRAGLSVGRRVGGAVRRNRVKRLLREAIRHRQHDLPTGYDLVINVGAHEPMPVGEYQRLLASAMKSLHRRWSRKTDDRELQNGPAGIPPR